MAILRFALKYKSKNLNFKSFLSLKTTFVATFNLELPCFSKMLAPISRKYVAEEDIMMLTLLQTSQIFWLHFSVFALEK